MFFLEIGPPVVVQESWGKTKYNSLLQQQIKTKKKKEIGRKEKRKKKEKHLFF